MFDRAKRVTLPTSIVRRSYQTVGASPGLPDSPQRSSRCAGGVRVPAGSRVHAQPIPRFVRGSPAPWAVLVIAPPDSRMTRCDFRTAEVTTPQVVSPALGKSDTWQSFPAISAGGGPANGRQCGHGCGWPHLVI